MRAITITGKILTGKIAEILVRNGRATALSDTDKKRGRPKKTVETDEELNKIPDNEEDIKKIPVRNGTVTKKK